MEAIAIPQLRKQPGGQLHIPVAEFLEGFESLTPVRGELTVTHCGYYLTVVGRAETIATLTCDRSLQQYNQRLWVDTQELIWLRDADAPPADGEVPLEQCWESLPPDGTFSPEGWLYEQLCLSLPLQALCGEESVQSQYAYRDGPQRDSRWAPLEALKAQLAESDNA